MDAAWAQAWISGAAIIASSGFAVWVPWRERRIVRNAANRRRLTVETESFPPAGLTISIHYRPEFWHVGHKCRVTLLEPKQALLMSMRWAVNVGTLVGGGHLRREADGVCIDGVAIARLDRISDDTVFGSIRLLPPANDVRATINEARLRFEIETDDGERLLKAELAVSAIERAPDQGFSIPAEIGPVPGADQTTRV